MLNRFLNYVPIFILTLFLVSIFYLKGFWIGFASVGYLLFLLSWIVSCRLLGFSLFGALLVFVGLHVGLSFVSFDFSTTFIYVTMLLIGVFLAVKRDGVREQVKLLYDNRHRFTWMDYAALGLFCIPILLYGISRADGLYSIDTLHHFYEMSWGNCYARHIVNAPDLSFFLRPAKFHFLGTRMAVFLSAVWHVNLEQSATFFLLLFYFPIFIGMLVVLMNVLQVSAPFWVLLMFPLFGLKSSFWFPTQSILLATFILLGSVIAFVLERWFVFFVLASFLLIAKASFFIVLLGALGLVFIKKPSAYFFMGLSVLLLVFGFEYSVFLSGAHQHILWVHFPGSILWLFYHEKWDLLFYSTVFISMLGWGFLKESKDSKLLFPIALGLSGIMGVLVLVEVTSGDHLQFLKAAGIPAVIALWGINPPVFFEKKAFKQILFYGISIVYGVVFLVQFKDVFAMQHPLISRDVITAYTELGHRVSPRDIVLYGKHYEVNLSFCADTVLRDQMWFARTGFERSALSGAQMLDESVKWKGVVMERSLPLRIAQTLLFYQTYVDLSDESHLRMSQFHTEWFGQQEPLAISEQSGQEALLLQHFGFKRDWYFVNQMDLLNRKIRNLLEYSQNQLLTGKDFLRFYHISYIVLEDGDQPTSALLEIATPVIQTPSVIVLQVNGGR